MEFIRAQVFCILVTVFIVLFCMDLACRVEGGTTVKIANVGDNVILSCNRPNEYFNQWYKNGKLIANWDGVFINDPRFTQGFSYNKLRDSNKIYISNIRMNDSDTFECLDYHNISLLSYDLRVIRCSNCIIATHSDQDKMKVMCTLDNYWTSQALSRNIILDGNIFLLAAINGSMFSFPIQVTDLNRLHSTFYLDIEIESRITCMSSTQPTPPSSPTTTLPRTSLKQTTQYRQSTLSYTASKTLQTSRSTSISTTKHHTPKNKNASSDQNTSDGNLTLIIAILGSAFILILIVIIIVLRNKQMSDRQENKHIGNASIKKEHPKFCYESVEDGFRKGPEYATSIKELRETSLDPRSVDHPENGEMIDNILYESTDKIADSSILRIEGPLDDALYAMPDKRATIRRESKSTSKVTDGSSNSDHLYGNSAIITQHEQNRDTLQQGDQYENVKMPGSGGDAEENPLYDMPDKGPMRKATPEAGQTSTLSKDEVVSVEALYAEVNKAKKK